MASQNGMNITDDPTAPSFIGTNMTIGGGATTLINATVGKGQGTWLGRIDNMTLNVTTPYQQIKAGAYTGNITEPRRRTINLSQTKSHPLRMTFCYSL